MKKDFTKGMIQNVKFFVPDEHKHLIMPFIDLINLKYNKKNIEQSITFHLGCFATYLDRILPFSTLDYYITSELKCVSMFEAIPGLIPDGMRYNKELDKLVPDVVSISDEYCSGIKVEFEKVVDYVDQKENISCKNEKSKHYELWNDFEAIDVLKNCLTRDEFIGFLKGNILKYQLRLGKKDDVSKEKEKIKDYQNELNFILKELEKNVK